MTAIAYRDGIMAADSLSTAGGVVQGVSPKIIKNRSGDIAGVAGEGSLCANFLQAFIDGEEEVFLKSMPPASDREGISTIIVRADGQVFHGYAGGMYPMDALFHADGCAHAMVIGAMAAGASAEEAVRIACEYDTRCRGPIQVLRLGPD